MLGENIYPDTIYKRHLDEHHVIFGKSSQCWTHRYNIPEGVHCSGAIKKGSLDRNVFLLSKQIRRETMRTGWQSGYKHFVRWRHHESVLTASVTSSEYNWLDKVRLNFRLDEHFETFGCRIDPDFHIPEISRPSQLQELAPRGLRHLELFFRDPYETTSPYVHLRVRATRPFPLLCSGQLVS